MKLLKPIGLFIQQWLQYIFCFIRTKFMTQAQKDQEIQALQSQLALFHLKVKSGKMQKPQPTPAFRQLWVLILKVIPKWMDSLILVKPETVIGWHKTAFKFYWKRKSKKSGRLSLSRKTIALIQKIHRENPLLSPEKIHERLVDMNVLDAPAPNTISKYIKNIRKAPSEKQKQSWKTFLRNHRKELWCMDFFVVPTLCFRLLYVFILVSHDRCKIEHFAVTKNPNSAWVAQQIREATPYGKVPKYLIHDNDSILTSKSLQDFLSNANVKVKKTGIHCPWQNGICERAVGIIRAELVNHIIPMNQKHLENLLHEYVEKYYHPVRTHQGINCQTPLLKDKSHPTLCNNTILKAFPILNELYPSYSNAA